jgi:hypothetical protein
LRSHNRFDRKPNMLFIFTMQERIFPATAPCPRSTTCVPYG